MTKVAITADIHFGVPGRLDDLLWACKVLRQYCKLTKIEVVFVCGDLFHDRQSIAIDVLHKVSQFFEETSNDYGQQWIVFPGNHDMFLRHSWEINSLSTLKNNLTVIDDIKIAQIDDRRFWILPFITYEKAYMKVLDRIHKQYQEGDVLLTHIGVRNATLNTCFLLKDWSSVTFEHSRFERVYTGHFHSTQSLYDRVYYPGSLIPFKFDEGDVSHGFYVLDVETLEHKFIDIWKAGAKIFPNESMPPQYYTLTDDVIQDLDTQDIAGGMVRVALQKDFTSDEKRAIREHLTSIGAVGVRFMDLTKKIQQKATISEVPTKDLFSSWVENDEKGTKGLDNTLLSKLNNEIITEGDEKYSVEESE